MKIERCTISYLINLRHTENRPKQERGPPRRFNTKRDIYPRNNRDDQMQFRDKKFNNDYKFEKKVIILDQVSLKIHIQFELQYPYYNIGSK